MAKTTAVAFRNVMKMPLEVSVGDLMNKGEYKVTSIKSVKALSFREVEIIGLCRKVEKK